MVKYIYILALMLITWSGYSQQVWDWAIQGFSPEQSFGTGVVVDEAGNIYVTGEYKDSITIQSTLLTDFPFEYANFIIKLDPMGNVVWTKEITGPNPKHLTGIALDSTNNIYVCGYFMESVNVDSISLFSGSNTVFDLFVAKYDNNGNLQWAKSGGGGMGNHAAFAIAVDPAGNCYVTGYGGNGGTFDTITISGQGGYDILTIKYNTDGNALWADAKGLSNYDGGFDIALDQQGNCYITGYDSDATLTQYIWTGKYSSDGVYQWLDIGSAGNGWGIGVDSLGNSYVTGNGYLTKYDTGGNEVWSQPQGGYGNHLVSDEAGNITVTGNCSISQYDANGVLLDSISGTNCTSMRVFTSANGSNYITGEIGGTSILGLDTLDGLVSSFFIAKTTNVTEVDPIISNHNLLLYPNPTTGEFTIDLPEKYREVSMFISNGIGQLISSKKFRNTHQINFELVGAKGLYFVHLYTERGVVAAMKLLKK